MMKLSPGNEVACLYLVTDQLLVQLGKEPSFSGPIFLHTVLESPSDQPCEESAHGDSDTAPFKAESPLTTWSSNQTGR